MESKRKFKKWFKKWWFLEGSGTLNQKTNSFLINFGKACGCHQKKERSFHFKGKQFFLCARCTGIFFGQMIIAPIFYFLGLHFGEYTILFAIPLFIDGTLQYYTKYESNNFKRLITGLLGGYGIAIIIIHIIVLIIKTIF